MAMQLSVVYGKDSDKYPVLMNEAYRLRHKIFVEEMGWMEIYRDDGLEKDQFDNEDALHMFLHVGEKLVGYQRLLPTTKPYLLSEIYPHLCEFKFPNSERIWEWTRFAVAKEHRNGRRKLSLAGNILLSAIVEWGIETGVDQIVIEMNPIWMLTLSSLHFLVMPLGIPQDIAGESTLAVIAKFDERTLRRLQEMRENTPNCGVQYFSVSNITPRDISFRKG